MRISNIAKYTVKSRFPGDKTAPLAVSFEYSLQIVPLGGHSQVITTTRNELNYLCSAVPSWQEKAFRGQGMYYNVTITSCMSCSNTCKQLLTQFRMSCYIQEVLFPQITRSNRSLGECVAYVCQAYRRVTVEGEDWMALAIDKYDYGIF